MDADSYDPLGFYLWLRHRIDNGSCEQCKIYKSISGSGFYQAAIRQVECHACYSNYFGEGK